MAIVDRTTLKSYFETGDRPTQGQFANLIDSAFNLAEDQSVGQGWRVELFKTEESTDPDQGGLMATPIPINANSLNTLRLFGRVNLDAGETDADVNVLLLYASDIQVPGLVSVDNGDGLFIHKVVGSTDPIQVLDVTTFTTSGVFDESFTPQLNFQFPDFGFFYYLTTINRAEFSYHLVGLEYS